MPRPLRNSRLGFYECGIADGVVTKGKYIRGDYIGVFNWDDLVSKIIPDLRQNNRLRGFVYPFLVTSWQLRGSDPSKARLGISRGSLPQPRRKKITATERWEAIIDHSGQAIKVEGRRVVGS